MRSIYATQARVRSLYQCDGSDEVQVRTSQGQGIFSITPLRALNLNDEIWVVMRKRRGVGGTVIGVVRGKEVLFKNTETCPEAIKFSVLLAMSRSRGFNSLAEDDRIWLMKHNEHARKCPDCLGALAGHKELGG